MMVIIRLWVIRIEETEVRFKGKNIWTPVDFYQLNKPVTDSDIIKMYIKSYWRLKKVLR